MSFNQSPIGRDFEFKNLVIGEFEIVGEDYQPKENLVVLAAVPRGTKFRVLHICSDHTKDKKFPYKVLVRIDTAELKDRIVDATPLFRSFESITAPNV